MANLPEIHGLVVCVDYDDVLALTLPRTLATRLLKSLTVITSPSDFRTQNLVAKYIDRGANCLITNAFYSNGAHFNKGLAMEEGFDSLGRTGWILILDADILLPLNVANQFPPLRVGKLYSPFRRIHPNPEKGIPPDHEWIGFPRKAEAGHHGYFQLFNGSDPVLKDRPWYATDVPHAGICDNVFQKKWAKNDKIRPPWTVLHLGPHGTNWHGRASLRIDDGSKVEGAEERWEKQKAVTSRFGWRISQPF